MIFQNILATTWDEVIGLKIRHDYVTNSSSSSFVISRDNISRDRLVEILLEIANKEALSLWADDEPYVNYDEIAYRYVIYEATDEQPYNDVNYSYDNDFIIDNDSCCRYDWDAVEDVLAKYNIPWHMGYCD